MGYNDSKNPLGYILPAGLLAYVASPKVREAVREAAVKGVAAAMDLADRAEAATTGLREELNSIMQDADQRRREGQRPAVRIEVEDENDQAGEPPADAEPAAA